MTRTNGHRPSERIPQGSRISPINAQPHGDENEKNWICRWALKLCASFSANYYVTITT